MLSFSSPSVKITPKILAKFASLNSSIAFGDLRLGGCLRGPPSQAPARAQSPARNTRIKRRKIRRSFVGYFDVPESRVFTPEFLVRALTVTVHINIIIMDTAYNTFIYYEAHGSPLSQVITLQGLKCRCPIPKPRCLAEKVLLAFYERK